MIEYIFNLLYEQSISSYLGSVPGDPDGSDD